MLAGNLDFFVFGIAGNADNPRSSNGGMFSELAWLQT